MNISKIDKKGASQMMGAEKVGFVKEAKFDKLK